MKPEICLVRLEEPTIYHELQIEEALLRIDSRNFCLIQKGSPDSIVMGISGKPEELINLELLRKKPVPVIKRFSGGGTVFVDRDTFFVSFICRTDALQVSCCPDKVFSWSRIFYRDFFHDLPFEMRERDYVFHDRKCGGSAQYLCKDRWLHHSSFLWNYSDHNMDYLLLPKRRPEYRQSRSHSDFLTRLSHYLNDESEFEKRLLKTLSTHFKVTELDAASVKTSLNLPHRKSTVIL